MFFCDSTDGFCFWHARHTDLMDTYGRKKAFNLDFITTPCPSRHQQPPKQKSKPNTNTTQNKKHPFHWESVPAYVRHTSSREVWDSGENGLSTSPAWLLYWSQAAWCGFRRTGWPRLKSKESAVFKIVGEVGTQSYLSHPASNWWVFSLSNCCAWSKGFQFSLVQQRLSK